MIIRALHFVNEKHKMHLRKGSNMPYVFHLTETAGYIAQIGCDEEMVVASLLHDCIEDVGVTYDEIIILFGSRVANMVKAVSESDKTMSWKDRKLETINDLMQCASEEVKLISCADKLSNIRSILFDIQIMGDEIWNKFNACYDEQMWYYYQLVKCYESLENNYIYTEFVKTVDMVFNL